MPSLHKLTESEFKDVFENLDVDCIVPILMDLKLLSPQDRDKLGSKSKKPAVKIIINKAREHEDGAELFQCGLMKSLEIVGHQKILSVLFPKANLLQQQGSHYILYILVHNTL